MEQNGTPSSPVLSFSSKKYKNLCHQALPAPVS